ncbi:hypothetical protein [Lederbergia lenta]|uniref:Cytochrome b561 domain-containing protein n=1 Tax=Lederbergia lenta TaxID=1467 RepID=A0A2X4WFH9_LEDLE|nr:hypothetical protein [Lederbergia lenta]MCM3111719.1 hypothetical protein [Lederbergia lenta]MEC2322872.1 hypothetical protein [Lederbergia lenta]SQI61941.1 Uncharacterised protein [Lederbergia lenta]
MNGRNLLLIRFSAIFSVIGAVLGAHMAGAGSYAFRPIHAHILVLGWLTLFAWGVYYEIFQIKSKKIALWHTWTAIIGTIGLTLGMWLNFIKPFNIADGVSLVFYIGGGVIILISFILFFITTFFIEKKSSK